LSQTLKFDVGEQEREKLVLLQEKLKSPSTVH
jgi:hypothetical protein